MKVHHFDIGVVGHKEFIGEGGFTAAAFAGAGAFGAAEGRTGGGAGGRNEGERGVGLEAGGRQLGGGGRGGGVAREKGNVGSKTNSHSHCHSNGRSSRKGGNYLVSAVTEWGADVFAAKVSDLLPLQAAAIKVCWIEGREVGRAGACCRRRCAHSLVSLWEGVLAHEACSPDTKVIPVWLTFVTI